MNKYNMIFLKEELALKQYLMKLLVNETTSWWISMMMKQPVDETLSTQPVHQTSHW